MQGLGRGTGTGTVLALTWDETGEAVVRPALSVSPGALLAAAGEPKVHLHNRANSSQDSDLTSREQIISLQSPYREQY